MLMAFSFAADIFVEQGIRSDLERPRLRKTDSPPSIDWQPVSAMAGFITSREGLGFTGLTPNSEMSEGTAWIVMSINGCGSEFLRSHILHRSLYTWWEISMDPVAQISSLEIDL